MSLPGRDERLELLARYARVVVAQEERLLAGDEEGFARHALERRELQERVDALQRPDGAEAPEPAERREVMRLLEQAWASDERMGERLRSDRARRRSELRDVERRGGQARRYLATGHGVERALDLTL